MIREDGMTLIEVVVAAFCLAVVAGAAATQFAISDRSSLSNQHNSQLIAAADQQLEAIRQQVKTSGFSSLALSSAPSTGSNSTLPGSTSVHTDPNDFVSASSGCGTKNLGYLIENNWDDASEGVASGVSPWSGCPTGAEPLVVSATGFVAPKQTITVGGLSATAYAYVTDTNIGCATTTGTSNGCYTSGTSSYTPVGDAKRVIVAVVLGNGGTNNIGTGASYTSGQNSPVYVSTIFANPVPSNQVNSSIGITLGVNLG
jgi:type II secretory pathway pseudopilin PulG